MESDTISLIIIVFCIIMSAYFSATETAFSSLNRIRVKNMAEKGNKRAALVLKLSEDYDGMLSTILIGNNIVNIACASLSTLIFVRFLGDEAGASVSTVVDVYKRQVSQTRPGRRISIAMSTAVFCVTGSGYPRRFYMVSRIRQRKAADRFH